MQVKTVRRMIADRFLKSVRRVAYPIPTQQEIDRLDLLVTAR